MKNLVALISVLILFSCENSNVNKTKTKVIKNKGKKDSTAVLHTQNDVQSPQVFKDAVAFAHFCIEKLQTREALDLKPYVENGVVLSPNAHIDTLSVRKVGLEELSTPTKELQFWGIYPGRGDSILLSTADYVDKFIFNFDLDNAEINSYQGNPKARGSEQINIQDLFPSATTVAFYKPPSKEGYMDWNALYFVVQKTEGHFVLKAIVHNQWSP